MVSQHDKGVDKGGGGGGGSRGFSPPPPILVLTLLKNLAAPSWKSASYYCKQT